VTAVSPRRFSDVSAVIPEGEGRLSGEVDPEWTIRGKPNGGYLLAMLGRAAATITSHEHVITASAQYVRTPDPGAVSIEVELLRAGRSASQIRASMSQDGQRCVEALITTSQLDPASRPHWTAGAPAAGSVPYEDSVPLVAVLPDGSRVAIMDQIELRLEPDSAGFTRGQPRGIGELRGWLGLPEGEPFDPASLLFAVDAYPPATFDIEFAGWVPTLELTVYVRALPAPGPVRVLQRAQLIDAQRVDEVCFVWDGTGRLVAHGVQLAGIRLG
jgi:acyl-coenzyme A thioesterase PaaI-like protein